jgi:hypothetical protein
VAGAQEHQADVADDPEDQRRKDTIPSNNNVVRHPATIATFGEAV